MDPEMIQGKSVSRGDVFEAVPRASQNCSVQMQNVGFAVDAPHHTARLTSATCRSNKN